jgi:hypothetical protein
MCIGVHVKRPLSSSDFDEIWILSTCFPKILGYYQFFIKNLSVRIGLSKSGGQLYIPTCRSIFLILRRRIRTYFFYVDWRRCDGRVASNKVMVSLLSLRNLRQKGGYETSQPDMDKQRLVLFCCKTPAAFLGSAWRGWWEAVRGGGAGKGGGV